MDWGSLFSEHAPLFNLVNERYPGLGREVFRALMCRGRLPKDAIARLLPEGVERGLLVAMGNSRLYREFCEAAFGCFVDYSTRRPAEKEHERAAELENTRKVYRRIFKQEPPPVWHEAASVEWHARDGSVDIDLVDDDDDDDDDDEQVTPSRAERKRQAAAAPPPGRGSLEPAIAHGKRAKTSTPATTEFFTIDCSTPTRKFRLQVMGAMPVADLNALAENEEPCPENKRRVFIAERRNEMFAQHPNHYAAKSTRRLQNDLTLEEVWQEGDSLAIHYYPKPSPSLFVQNSFNVVVASMMGRKVTLQVQSDMTSLNLKTLVANSDLRVPEDQHRLLLKGWPLQDWELLWERGIMPETSLHLVLKLQGC